jgi:hypothetical protein
METHSTDSTGSLKSSPGQADKRKIFLNTVLWGFILWLFGYILGIVFFAFVSKDKIGWYILPLGIIFTLWVLFKKIEREELMCYFGLGLIWMIMAVALDYFFLVKLFHSADYYKTDVYIYYVLTFILPMAVGWYKFKLAKKSL